MASTPEPRASPPPGSEHTDAAAELSFWSRAKALFLEALDQPDSGRRAWVIQACGADSRLRGEVESLLDSELAAADLWESPAVQLLSDAPSSEWGFAEPRLPAGARIGSYVIEEFIAAGGMGRVYRARHTILGREVAIKTVAGAAAGESGARRLIREAKHASTLTHPNICTIYEVGEGESGPFIVMQYVAGRPLSAIVRDGPPSIEVALGYAAQITDALEHAHSHGIIHRDLKSSNIVVNADGRAVVLDFGLAKKLPTAGAQSREPTVTRDGLAGTLSHMAPEVLRGAPADVRTDIWALGVLLYELATGELPFTGRTPYETSSAILGDTPRPMATSVPLALRLVIERCLIKEPDGRYQRASDVRAALEAIRRRRAWPLVGRLLVSVRRRTLIATGVALAFAVAVAVAAPTILRRIANPATGVSTLAILPLANATHDPAADYYAVGVTEALTTQLGAASSVRVISPASAASIAGRAKTLREAGTQLAADGVLQGSVSKTGDRVAVDLHLVQPANGRVLWSDRFERDSRDILALEADVVRNLADAVRLTLRSDARDRLATVRAVAPEAYEEYLKGRYEWNNRTPRSLQAAIDHFNRAAELDPTYAPAHAALADCYNQLGTVMVGTGSPREFRPRAAAEAIKALQLDPYSAEAHAALGYVDHYNWQWTDAEREFRRAIALNPSYSLVRIWYANLLMSRNRMSESVQQVSIARDLDPFSLIVNTNVGWVLDAAGRHADAVRQLRAAIVLDSTYVQAHFRLADALVHTGRVDEGIAEGQRLLAMSNRSASALSLVATAYARAGDSSSARALLHELLARSDSGYVPAWSIASVLEALGDRDGAMTWLEKAYAERSNGIAYLLGDTDMRGDPRFEAMLARVGLK
jgi:serine/threonine-protein kinase